jgi:uncharacterized membrane protein
VTALFFVCLVGCIFASIVLTESQTPRAHLRFGPGLLGWLISGNWPAKVGGVLLVVGSGALLRYAMLNVEIEPSLKLASGAAARCGIRCCLPHGVQRLRVL